jgi:S-adenosylmethionine synthetase
MSQNKENYFFTSESVSEGHPDKVCDQISDSILDIYMKADKDARVACETLATTNKVVIAGEVRLNKNLHLVDNEIIENVIREKVKNIGYEQKGFHWKNLEIQNFLHKQSEDIAQGVDEITNEKDQGAGDQGIMFGYACSETPNFMPATIEYSHKILKYLSKFRKENDSFFGPDSKSQVTIKYKNGIPQNITSIVVSTQHHESASNNEIRKKVIEIIEGALPNMDLPKDSDILINPTGRFVVGGPDGDAGLTGRKIIVDTYGGAAPHGGGAFSGKDYTKVDRSAAYIARYIAKNIVASEIAKKCLIQLSYAIGVSKPISIFLKTDDKSNVNTERLIEIINELIDLSPSGIKKFLKLDNPIYEVTSTYGHFGRKFSESKGSFTWENLSFVETLKKNYK